MGLGAGYHTLTLRLFPANLEYKIVNHAEDQHFNARQGIAAVCRYGIMGLGAVCHTLNPRLFVPDLEYIVNHAADKILMLDMDLAALIAKLRPKMHSVQQLIVLTDRQHMHKVVSTPMQQLQRMQASTIAVAHHKNHAPYASIVLYNGGQVSARPNEADSHETASLLIRGRLHDNIAHEVM